MQRQPFDISQLWPLALLLLGETAAFVLIARLAPLGVTRFSLLIAATLLVMGLLLAGARPRAQTRLAGALAILLASLLVVPLNLATLPPLPPQMLFTALPAHAILRLINGMFTITVGLHLVLGLPTQPGAYARRWSTQPHLWALYGMTLLLTTLVLWLPGGWPRFLAGVTLVGWSLVQLAVAHWQLICMARRRGEGTHGAHQARLLLLGLVLAEAPLLLRMEAYLLGGGQVIPYPVALLFQLALPVTVTYAVLRHDLFGIDAAVRRALAYAGLTSVLLSIYFAMTLLLTGIITDWAPQFQRAAILVVVLGAAVAFRPLYGHIQHWVDRILYPERLAFYQEMAALRQALRQVLHPEEVLRLLAEKLPQQLDVTWASLALVPQRDLPGRTNPPPVWNSRLVVGDRVLGRFWLGPRRSGLDFSREELAQLQGLVEQAALALAYGETLSALNLLNTDLERQVESRTAQMLDQQRALAVAEERQRLARDLHDSVTQTLFSMGLGARALAKLAQKDPAATVQGLREQEQAAQQALAEMRALLSQLRSPLLGDDDFGQSLTRCCEMITHQFGLAVTLDAPNPLTVPAEMDSQLLSVVREALTNAAKHSQATGARCTVTKSDDTLEILVVDDGIGFQEEAPITPSGTGLGLHTMQERVDALGGQLTIEGGPGRGVRVQIRVGMRVSNPVI